MFMVNGGQQVMTDGTFLPQFVADPEGALVSSGQYRASGSVVSLGEPGYGTAYGFAPSGSLIAVETGVGDPRRGWIRCEIDWEGWPDW